MKGYFGKSVLGALLLSVLILGVGLGKDKGQASNSEPIEFRNASVHDPSIIKDPVTGEYYVFGSHIDGAKSTDLVNWDTFTNGYITPNNKVYGDLSENLAESFEWAGENDADSKGGYAVWAPDIFWNKHYVNEDGKKGAYMLYYSVSSTYIRSAIGIAVSKNIEGPFKYVDTIMYSGFTNKEAYDRNSDVNKHWENTNIADLIKDRSMNKVNPDWFTESGEYNNKLYTNAIDANILEAKNNKLYMTYGSWSGGTFILELDKKTGLPKYPGKDGKTKDGRIIDRYFGTKIASGYGRSAEGTYAVYDKEADYYYLYITYGGLAADGGYQMRQFRSKNPDGPYVDAKGNAAVFPESFDSGVGNFPSKDDHKDIGNKMMGNFLFKRNLGEQGTGIGTGYLSPGHNSYLIDKELGKEFIVTHARFPEQGEMHEIRVHQTFKNKDDWPVPTPYRYAGEKIEKVSETDIIGDYKYINHGKEITGELTESTWIKFNKDHTISGSETGKWKIYGKYKAEVTIDNKGTYDGVFIRQYDPTSRSWVMTFSAMSDEGIVIWGSHVEASSDEEIVKGIKQVLSTSFPSTVISNFTFPKVETRGAQITWESSNPEVISTEGVVIRPSLGSEDAVVDLTATIRMGNAIETLTVSITVIAKAEGGLSAYYNFNEDLKDSSGNKGEATVTGDRLNNTSGQITFAEGVVGQAAKFDGKSGLRLADGLITGETYTVSFWLKPDKITEFTTAFFGAKTSDNWISILPKTTWGNTMVWSRDGDTWYDAITDKTIPIGEWTHLVLTVNEGNVVFYINGEAKYTGGNFPNIFTSTDAVFGLGVNYWDVPFEGLMDEVRVYDGVALPANELQILYHNPEELEAAE